MTTRMGSAASVRRSGRAAKQPQPRPISPAIDAAVRISNGTPSAQRRSEKDLESQLRLLQALRTLRGIRQRHKIARITYPESGSLTVHVALDDGDMRWVAAVIEALEQAIVDATEAA